MQERLKTMSGTEAEKQQAIAKEQAKMAARLRESELAWKKQLEESKAEVEAAASQMQQVRIWLCLTMLV